MAKKTSLLAEIKSLPDVEVSRKGNWHDDVKRRWPAFADEMDGIIKMWIDGDPTVTKKFPEQKQLVKFFLPKLAELNIHISPNSVGDLIRAKKRGA